MTHMEDFHVFLETVLPLEVILITFLPATGKKIIKYHSSPDRYCCSFQSLCGICIVVYFQGKEIEEKIQF